MPTARQFTIRTAVHHDATDADIDEYAAATEKIVREHGAVFGEFPEFDGGTYTFLGDYVPWGGGDGMEHRNSTVVAEGARSSGNVRGVLGTVSHEFFHAWNVERIRPKTLEPFYFEDANMSGELWLAEGFTQYYGQLIMARAGLAAGEQTLLALANSALGVRRAPAHRFRSAVEMSQMAPFTDAARANDPTNFGYASSTTTRMARRSPSPSISRCASVEWQGDARRLHARDVAGARQAGRGARLRRSRTRSPTRGRGSPRSPIARLPTISSAATSKAARCRTTQAPRRCRRHGPAPQSRTAWTGAAIDASGRVTALRGLIGIGARRPSRPASSTRTY